MKPIDMNATDYNAEYLGLSRLCLMENAGKALADEVTTISTYKFSKPVKIIIFTGSGGNAGDGFVAARHLLNRGFSVEIQMLTAPNNLKHKDTIVNYQILENTQPHFQSLKINQILDSNDLNNIKTTDIQNPEEDITEAIIIDAILGTGIKGKLKTLVRSTIEYINNASALKVAVDVPSGLDPETGDIMDIAVEPDYTVSFHKVKDGVRNAGEAKVGGLVISDIGIPLEAEIFVGDGDLLRLKKRDPSSHKGSNGKILVVGGSEDYTGAPALAGLTALATGADLAYVACPESAQEPIKSYSPDIIVKSLKGNILNIENQEEILKLVDEVDCVLMGCGSGQNEETRILFNSLAVKIKKPLVLDADALKLIDFNLIKNNPEIIITPHMREMEAFFQEKIQKHQSLSDEIDNLEPSKLRIRIAGIQKITNQIKGTILLKGRYDLVFQKNNFKLNKTGSPFMTVGGTGDCLAGMVTALRAQNNTSFDAATLAAFLLGKAGELAGKELSEGLTASQLPKYIPLILK